MSVPPPNAPHPPARRGILAGGNFITDFVKIISDWPQQEALASIRSESMSNGGGPYNLLKDLAALQVDLPLEALGMVGADANGEWIIDDCRRAGIEVSQLHRTHQAPTSYTDAMTVQETGRRTFFHQPGANATLARTDFSFTQTRCRLFMLGFLMLLESLDTIAEDGRTGASHVLEAASQAGLTTAADFVSASSPKFRAVAVASLPYLDLLFLNELEASRILEAPVTTDPSDLTRAAQELLAMGVRQIVVLHTADGAVAVEKNGSIHLQGRVLIPEAELIGTTGAGDAFAAGFLYAWHEHLPPSTCLNHAVCVAASSLYAASASAGIRPLPNCLALGHRFGYAIM